MKDRYEQLEQLAQIISEHLDIVREDGMSIVIYVADQKKIKSLCCCGEQIPLLVLAKLIVDTLSKEYENLN